MNPDRPLGVDMSCRLLSATFITFIGSVPRFLKLLLLPDFSLSCFLFACVIWLLSLDLSKTDILPLTPPVCQLPQLNKRLHCFHIATRQGQCVSARANEMARPHRGT